MWCPRHRCTFIFKDKWKRFFTLHGPGGSVVSWRIAWFDDDNSNRLELQERHTSWYLYLKSLWLDSVNIICGLPESTVLLPYWVASLAVWEKYFKDILIKILFFIPANRGWPAPVDWDVACAASCIDGASGSRNYHPSRGTCNARHVP